MLENIYVTCWICALKIFFHIKSANENVLQVSLSKNQKSSKWEDKQTFRELLWCDVCFNVMTGEMTFFIMHACFHCWKEMSVRAPRREKSGSLICKREICQKQEGTLTFSVFQHLSVTSVDPKIQIIFKSAFLFVCMLSQAEARWQILRHPHFLCLYCVRFIPTVEIACFLVTFLKEYVSLSV